MKDKYNKNLKKEDLIINPIRTIIRKRLSGDNYAGNDAFMTTIQYFKSLIKNKSDINKLTE